MAPEPFDPWSPSNGSSVRTSIALKTQQLFIRPKRGSRPAQCRSEEIYPMAAVTGGDEALGDNIKEACDMTLKRCLDLTRIYEDHHSDLFVKLA
ncbi:hypothetical protein N7475_000965 [Penicillium sp. IBT 31633x]|nr:hypothetical protein N7475_000965 [Penicillium sp. IBT 31633x]